MGRLRTLISRLWSSRVNLEKPPSHPDATKLERTATASTTASTKSRRRLHISSPDDVSKMSTSNELFDRIDEALTCASREADDLQKFMPASKLSELLCAKTVTAALKEKALGNSKTAVKNLTSYVRTDALKTFAILASIGMVKHINQFYDAGFNDTMLPLSREQSKLSTHTKSLCHIVDKAFASWETSWKQQFCTNQWPYLAPVFRQGQFRYEIHRLSPMPILGKNSDVGHSTHFSEVEQWLLHKDHLKGHTVCPAHSTLRGHAYTDSS
jgi:ElaB/YqjD/DUF883 family membrane-anchored ribosome-binding protein